MIEKIENKLNIQKWSSTKTNLIKLYNELFNTYGDTAEAIQMSKEGQLFRFQELSKIGLLDNCTVLDIGCGRGDLYPFLIEHFKNVDYTGIDIVPELINQCLEKYQGTNFQCIDLFEQSIDQKIDYVFISMVFNNVEMGHGDYFKKMISIAYDLCETGLAFNFTSNYKNFDSNNSISYDPSMMLDFCLNNITRHLSLNHNYEKCDVSMFLYK